MGGQAWPCRRCHKIKQVCDGGSPCARCQRLEHSCIPRTTVSASNITSKARIRRVKTGCVTCRRRKRKCDETKPSCGDCSRLHFDCEWLAKHNDPSQETPRDDVGSIDVTQPSQYGVKNEDDIVLQAKDEDGRCERSMADLPLFEATTPACQESAMHPSPTTSVPRTLPQLTCPDDGALFQHYCWKVSALLCRRASTLPNPYISYFVPMALQDRAVMHCILALSASHWCRMRPDMGQRGLEHQSRAFQELRSIDPAESDTALVCSLLLCMAALFDGNIEVWQLLFNVAKHSLTMLRHQTSSPRTNFLLRLFKFLESADAVSPYRQVKAQEAAVTEMQKAAPDEDEFAVYGIPEALFSLVDDVGTLSRETRECSCEPPLRQQADQIERRILNVSLQAHYAVARLLSKDSTHVVVAFKCALRLRLHQITEGYAIAGPKVCSIVGELLGAVQKVQAGSPLELCLTFPLIMASISCWEPERLLKVQERLDSMKKTCGFEQIYAAADLVLTIRQERGQAKATDGIIRYPKLENMLRLVAF